MTVNHIEKTTKQGHGLYLLSSNSNDVGEIVIGILGKGKGLFPAWLLSRGIDLADIPEK